MGRHCSSPITADRKQRRRRPVTPEVARRVPSLPPQAVPVFTRDRPSNRFALELEALDVRPFRSPWGRVSLSAVGHERAYGRRAARDATRAWTLSRSVPALKSFRARARCQTERTNRCRDRCETRGQPYNRAMATGTGSEDLGALNTESTQALRDRAERLWPVSVDRVPQRREGLRGTVAAPVKALLRPFLRWYVAPIADAQRDFNDVMLKLTTIYNASSTRGRTIVCSRSSRNACFGSSGSDAPRLRRRRARRQRWVSQRRRLRSRTDSTTSHSKRECAVRAMRFVAVSRSTSMTSAVQLPFSMLAADVANFSRCYVRRESTL